jgi:predicted RNase H-like HicB family nuclease
MSAKGKFTGLIKRDRDGFLVAMVSALRGCRTQAKNLDAFFERVREAAALCAETRAVAI